MKFWWVNQNQTWKHEISGGYMWSPKLDKNNRFNRFYENMRLVDPGDIVFSFYKQHLQKIGIVQSVAITADRPREFGKSGEAWAPSGWFVPIHWDSLPEPIYPATHILQLRPHLPKKYSPLNPSTGTGYQRYLVYVSDSLAAVLFSLIGVSGIDDFDELIGMANQEGSINRVDDQVEEKVLNDTNLSETEKEAIVKARRGQGRFRKNVAAIEVQCRVTGVSDSRLLRASHIKPWRSCSNNAERIDGNNGLMCTPHIDHLFDQGYITFRQNGAMKVSTRIPFEQLQLLGINGEILPNVGNFSDMQEKYLKYHRDHVFVKS